MKISYLWLKELVDVSVSADQLADDLTNVGVVVETVTPFGSDLVFELDLTTNRPDCLSHTGVAREVAALYQKRMRPVEDHLEESSQATASQIAVEIEPVGLCTRYSARVVVGVKVAPSPEWLAQRLESVGVRPVNNIVDVTNYVLMEMGHPLHGFDLSKVAGRKIIVREARHQEKLVMIDGDERQLSPGMLVIADRHKPLALAGIMGGMDSEINLSTKDILLESAWFDPISIRKTSKALGMHTEASHRFERGADVAATVPALDRTAYLLQQLGGGEILRGVVDCYPAPMKRGAIFLRKSRISQVLGIEIADAHVERILAALGFSVLEKRPDGWNVDSPTSRLDVEREIDLIEEITRHYGYGKIPATLPVWKGSSVRQPEYSREKVLKERLLHVGYSETVTYSFVDEAETRRFSSLQPVRLLNPLSSEMEVMRTSLMPGLLRSLLWNYNRGIKSLRIYEIGKAYQARDCYGPQETHWLGMISTGYAQERNVHGDYRLLNFFDLKGDIEILLESFKIPLDEVRFVRQTGSSVPGTPCYYHPGGAAEMLHHETTFGIFGQLHPGVCDEYKIRQEVFVAEIPLDLWHKVGDRKTLFIEVSRFPSIQRDLSIVVDQEIPYSEIEAVIHQTNISEARRVLPFDLYAGEKVPAGKKGMSINIVYQASDRTLVEGEVNEFHARILSLLKEKLGAQLRS